MEDINFASEEKIKQILKLFPDVYLKLNDKEKYLSYLLEQNPENIKYVEEKEKAIIDFDLVGKYRLSSLMKFVESPSKKLIEHFLSHDKSCIDYLPDLTGIDRNIIIKCVKRYKYAVKFLDDDEFSWIAILQDPEMILNVNRQTEEMQKYCYNKVKDIIWSMKNPSEQMKIDYLDYVFHRKYFQEIDSEKVLYLGRILKKFGDFSREGEIKIVKMFADLAICFKSPCKESILFFLENTTMNFDEVSYYLKRFQLNEEAKTEVIKYFLSH